MSYVDGLQDARTVLENLFAVSVDTGSKLALSNAIAVLDEKIEKEYDKSIRDSFLFARIAKQGQIAGIADEKVGRRTAGCTRYSASQQSNG